MPQLDSFRLSQGALVGRVVGGEGQAIFDASTRGSSSAEQALSAMRERYSEPLTMAGLARTASLTASRFYEAFSAGDGAHTGVDIGGDLP
jgi:hypothetical protein